MKHRRFIDSVEMNLPFYFPNHNEKASEAFAKDLIGSISETGFLIDGSDYFITPSIGISIFPNDGDDANTLIKHADTAMYYVKGKRKK